MEFYFLELINNKTLKIQFNSSYQIFFDTEVFIATLWREFFLL